MQKNLTKKFIITNINLDSNFVKCSNLYSFVDLLGSDYEKQIRKLKLNESYTELNFKPVTDYTSLTIITRIL